MRQNADKQISERTPGRKKGRPANCAATFWDKVDIRGPDECWPWKLSLRNGYGHYGERYTSIGAHRRAYELATGLPAPRGRKLQVLHSCNNKRCCNPNHLSVGTAAQNSQDAHRDGLVPSRKGERHHLARLTTEAVLAIFNDPRTYSVIGAEHGIAITTVSGIKNGYTWKHVTGGRRGKAA